MQLLDCALRDDTVTYARTNRDLTPGDYEDPSPLLTPELPDPDSPEHTSVTVTVHSASDEDSLRQVTLFPLLLTHSAVGPF